MCRNLCRSGFTTSISIRPSRSSLRERCGACPTRSRAHSRISNRSRSLRQPPAWAHSSSLQLLAPPDLKVNWRRAEGGFVLDASGRIVGGPSGQLYGQKRLGLTVAHGYRIGATGLLIIEKPFSHPLFLSGWAAL